MSASDKFELYYLIIFIWSLIIQFDSQELDSDTDITEIMEGDSELSRHLKQAWEVKEDGREENNGFMVQ